MKDIIQVASDGKKARYVLVYEKLYQMIMEGSFTGGKLPSEPKLAEMLCVSRMTLRQAIALLRDDGLIDNVRGKGNFIMVKPQCPPAGGLEKIGHPIYKCCTVKIDHVEVESRIDFPTDYMTGILERKSSAVVVFHRWYKSGEAYVAYSFSLVPIETLATFEIDTSQIEQITAFLEEGIYNAVEKSTLEVHLSETGEFISEKHVISNRKELNLIVERLYADVNLPLVVTKHYLGMDVCSMVIHAKIPSLKDLAGRTP